MSDRRSLLLSIFGELSYLFMQQGLRPSDYWRGLRDEEHPEIQVSLERAFELYSDELIELALDAKLNSLLQVFCKDKTGKEKDHCIKQIKMLVALDDYMVLHQEDTLDPGLWEKSPITAKYPEVRNILDEDGLFDVARGYLLDDERLQYGSDVFFYHPWLGYHFLREFLGFCHRVTTCDKKVAIDPRRILPARKYPVRFLEAYWYGPKFSLDNVDNPIYGVELTVHSRPPDSPRNMLGKLERTEFMWSMRENLKTLQVEELVPVDENKPAKRIAVRYVHTIRDTTRHAFVHLDGAIRWYLSENCVPRLNSKLSNHPDPDGYYKLFRLDGEIPNQDWIDLIANFFSGNELIHEYFGQPMEG